MYAITGTTGHLGQSILRQAYDSDIPVRAVIRKGSDRNLLKDLSSEIVEASLNEVESLVEAFSGCDVVIHAAALIEIRRGRKKAMRLVNVTGTENVLEACRRAGVHRMVYLSSIEAIDMKNPLRPISETHGFTDSNAVMEYGETKAEASRIVAEAGTAVTAGKEGPETVLICPTGIMGPWDFGNGLTTKMIRKYLAGRIPASVPGGFDYVDVRDVAGATLSAAAGRGRSGEAYLVTGEYLDVPGLLGLIGSVSGVTCSTPVLPVWLARLAGTCSEMWSLSTGSETLFTRGSVEILQVDAKIDRSKAEKELAYSSRPAEETITDTIAWIRGEENLDPAPAVSEKALHPTAG